MTSGVPFFLTFEIVAGTHEKLIAVYGGSHGIRDRGLIESAIAQGQNAFYYGGADVFTIAASYAFHLAESQAFIDGNKRIGATAALAFLLMNAIDVSKISSLEVYDMMIHIATKDLSKSGLADLLRSRLG